MPTHSDSTRPEICATLSMAERAHVPEADHQEQLHPAGPEGGGDNAAHAPSKDAPEADVFEQLTPAGPQPEQQLPVSSRVPREFIPEADALEQASPADRELFEDDE